MTWFVNGIRLTEFHGLTEDRISRLKYVATVAGVECFTTEDCPSGRLELRDRGTLVAVIDGVGKDA